MINALSYVDFHYVTWTTLTAIAWYPYYRGWAENQMLGSLPALKSSAAHLNLIWTSQVLTLQKPVFEEGEEMCGARKAWGWDGGGGWLEIVQEWVSFWAIQCFLILAGPEIPQKSFLKFPKSLEGLPLSSLPLLHTWVLADDKRQKYLCRGKQFNRKIPRYLRIVKRGLPLVE